MGAPRSIRSTAARGSRPRTRAVWSRLIRIILVVEPCGERVPPGTLRAMTSGRRARTPGILGSRDFPVRTEYTT